MNLNKLSYFSDEVNEYHPIMQSLVDEVLIELDLSKKYILKHHYGQDTRGIPDFVILDYRTKDYVFVLEVKKTPSDVLAKKYGEQSMNYANDLSLNWRNKSPQYFCVTNFEYTQLFCLRENSSLIGCLQEDSPYVAGSLSDKELYNNFKSIIGDIIKIIDSRKEPRYSAYLESITEKFNYSFYTVSTILGVNYDRLANFYDASEMQRQSILYELLRLSFFYYLKDCYRVDNSKLSQYFLDLKLVSESTYEELVSEINRVYRKVGELDFIDIFKANPLEDYQLDKKIPSYDELVSILIEYINTLENNSFEGVKKNRDVLHYITSITSEIYDKQQMHNQGKVMSDEILANLLVELCITDFNGRILDPCCGDGNLLLAAYKMINRSNTSKTHNKILGQLSGIEIDPNLIQLSALKLLTQNLTEVNLSTTTNLYSMDLFDYKDDSKYDFIIMNPPFLRNEDVNKSIKLKYLSNLELELNNDSFIRSVGQPNLYFYFIEKCLQLLDVNGSASIIVMAKFLSNKDGKYLREFLLPHLNSILLYPPTFFTGFAVTTCIINLNKSKNKNGDLSFITIKDSEFLSKLPIVKEIINSKRNINNSNFSCVVKNKRELEPFDNWMPYHIDPEDKYNRIKNLSVMTKLNYHFDTIARGKADNSGGSSSIYFDSKNNPLYDYKSEIEESHTCFGLKINKIPGSRRKIILTKECLNAQKSIKLNESYSSKNPKIGSDGASNYLREFKKLMGNKIYRIYKNILSSTVTPDIIIPRGDRNKHIVFYYPFNTQVVITTNFAYLSGIKNINNRLSPDDQVKFIVGFLNSSFGQLQFELIAGNQEGSRKIELFMIKELVVPNLETINQRILSDVVIELDRLDDQNIDYIGIEDHDVRKELDLVFANYFYSIDHMGFENSTELLYFAQNFLEELVSWRKNN